MHGNIISLNCTTICRVFYISLTRTLLLIHRSIPCMLILLCVHISMIINLRATCIACTRQSADEDIFFCCALLSFLFFIFFRKVNFSLDSLYTRADNGRRRRVGYQKIVLLNDARHLSMQI
jgi:hypothetical protein